MTSMRGSIPSNVIYLQRGGDMAKTRTSTEVKQRYKDKSYKRYQIYLRHDDDRELINWIDSHKDSLGTTSIFREALENYIKGEG